MAVWLKKKEKKVVAVLCPGINQSEKEEKKRT